MSWTATTDFAGGGASWIYDFGAWAGGNGVGVQPPPSIPAGYEEIDYFVFDPIAGSLDTYTPPSYSGATRYGGGSSAQFIGTAQDHAAQHLYIVLYPTGYPSDLTGTDPTMSVAGLVLSIYGGSASYTAVDAGGSGWVACSDFAGDGAGWVYDLGLWRGPMSGTFLASPSIPTGYDEIDLIVGDSTTGSLDTFDPPNLYDANRFRDGGGTRAGAFGSAGGHIAQHLYVVLYPTGYPSVLTGTDPGALDPWGFVLVDYGGTAIYPPVPTGGLWDDWTFIPLRRLSDYTSPHSALSIGLGINDHTVLGQLSDGNLITATPYRRDVGSVFGSSFRYGYDVFLIDPTGTILDHYNTELGRTDLNGREGTVAVYDDGIIIAANCVLTSGGAGGTNYYYRIRLDATGGSFSVVWEVSSVAATTGTPFVKVGSPTIHGVTAVDQGADLVVGVSMYANSVGAGWTAFFKMIKFSDGSYVTDHVQDTEVYLGSTQNGGVYYLGGSFAAPQFNTLTTVASGKMRGDVATFEGLAIMGINISTSGFTFDSVVKVMPAHVTGNVFGAATIMPPTSMTDVLVCNGFAGGDPSAVSTTWITRGTTTSNTSAEYDNQPSGTNTDVVENDFTLPQFGSEAGVLSNDTFQALPGGYSGAMAGAYLPSTDAVYSGPIRSGSYAAGNLLYPNVANDSERFLTVKGTRIYALAWSLYDQTAAIYTDPYAFVLCISPDMIVSTGFQGWGVPM